jgi:hypothetical protein
MHYLFCLSYGIYYDELLIDKIDQVKRLIKMNRLIRKRLNYIKLFDEISVILRDINALKTTFHHIFTSWFILWFDLIAQFIVMAIAIKSIFIKITVFVACIIILCLYLYFIMILSRVNGYLPSLLEDITHKMRAVRNEQGEDEINIRIVFEVRRYE